MQLTELQSGHVIHGAHVDASAHRERRRQRRLLRLVIVLAVPLAWFWVRWFSGNPVKPGLPAIVRNSPEISLLIVLLALMFLMMLVPYLGAGRSPHTLLR